MSERERVLVQSEDKESKTVAILEVANGNATVGTAWLECMVVSADTTVAELLEWREKVKRRGDVSGVGKLILSSEVVTK